MMLPSMQDLVIFGEMKGKRDWLPKHMTVTAPKKLVKSQLPLLAEGFTHVTMRYIDLGSPGETPIATGMALITFAVPPQMLYVQDPRCLCTEKHGVPRGRPGATQSCPGVCVCAVHLHSMLLMSAA
jgi:hypothetical protein